MNVGLLLYVVVSGENPPGGSSLVDIMSAYSVWFVVSALVVGAAWLVVYLPVYALVPRGSCFWRWSVCVPCGAVVGAIVPFGFWVIPEAVHGGSLGGLALLLLPGTVGVVAAVVGRWLVDWSRGYAHQRSLLEMRQDLRSSLEWGQGAGSGPGRRVTPEAESSH